LEISESYLAAVIDGNVIFFYGQKKTVKKKKVLASLHCIVESDSSSYICTYYRI